MESTDRPTRNPVLPMCSTEHWTKLIIEIDRFVIVVKKWLMTKILKLPTKPDF